MKKILLISSLIATSSVFAVGVSVEQSSFKLLPGTLAGGVEIKKLETYPISEAKKNRL